MVINRQIWSHWMLDIQELTDIPPARSIHLIKLLSASQWNIMPQIWLLVLGFVFISLFGNFSISYLLPCTTVPASLQALGCRPRGCNKGQGSARREIRKLKYTLSLTLFLLQDKHLSDRLQFLCSEREREREREREKREREREEDLRKRSLFKKLCDLLD